MTNCWHTYCVITLLLQGFRPHDYVKYNTFVTFYAWLVSLSFCFPFLSFPFILFSCSPPQVKRVNRFPWLRAQTMRFHPRKCLFGISLKKFEFTGSVTPKNRQKVGVVYGFPAKLGESIKTHISVKSRDIDTKFEP
jgi:hypothetical protein